MVLHIQPVTPPVKSMETRMGLLLGVVQDGVGGRPSRGVVQDVGQQCVVQLGGVVAAEDKEDAGADALCQVTLVAEQAGEAVDEPIAWKELANSHQSKDVIDDASCLCDPSQGSSHVSLTADWSQKVCHE